MPSTPPKALRPSPPVQPQGEISPGKDIDLRCTTAGSTSPCLGHNGFAVDCPLALLGSASSPIFCSSPRGFVPRFLHAGLTVRRSALHFARCAQLTRGLPPPDQCPCRA